MKDYVATFHTHLGALLSYRQLQKDKISCYMAPVPRKLSSSCGTCLFYTADQPLVEVMNEEVEGIYVIKDSQYEKIHSNS